MFEGIVCLNSWFKFWTLWTLFEMLVRNKSLDSLNTKRQTTHCICQILWRSLMCINNAVIWNKLLSCTVNLSRLALIKLVIKSFGSLEWSRRCMKTKCSSSTTAVWAQSWPNHILGLLSHWLDKPGGCCVLKGIAYCMAPGQKQSGTEYFRTHWWDSVMSRQAVHLKASKDCAVVANL